MITITRFLEFDAGHRVVGHEFKCKHLHGHRYRVEATFSGDELDEVGRLIDFGEIKRRLGAWLDEHWDHNTILWERDRALGEAIAAQTQQNIYYTPVNPTSENLAGYLLHEICPRLFEKTGIRCVRLTVHETPNCSATVTL